jgi:hypothetical protein
MAAVERLTGVVTLPARSAGTAARDTARRLRDWSNNAVDDWGRDPQFTARVTTLSRLRWDVAVGGAERLPAKAGALIVVNARRFALAPVLAALALGDAVDRPVRFVGRPDIAPVGPVMQRIGGLVAQPAEVEGALAAGQLVVIGASHLPSKSVAGAVDRHLVGAALATRVKVFPAATLSTPSRRSARVEVAAAVRPSRIRRGPLAELEMAELVERRLDELLVELGGSLTGTPLDWLASLRRSG